MDIHVFITGRRGAATAALQPRLFPGRSFSGVDDGAWDKRGFSLQVSHFPAFGNAGRALRVT